MGIEDGIRLVLGLVGLLLLLGLGRQLVLEALLEQRQGLRRQQLVRQQRLAQGLEPALWEELEPVLQLAPALLGLLPLGPLGVQELHAVGSHPYRTYCCRCRCCCWSASCDCASWTSGKVEAAADGRRLGDTAG